MDFNNISFPQGSTPYGSMTFSITKDSLFGMTSYGGANNEGLVFSIDTAGNGYTDLFDFNVPKGTCPRGSLILSGKVLYGMTNGDRKNISELKKLI